MGNDGKSPSSRRAWIEISKPFSALGLAIRSPSSRRAWIEISFEGDKQRARLVALLAEGVDRNLLEFTEIRKILRRPPRGGRG